MTNDFLYGILCALACLPPALWLAWVASITWAMLRGFGP